MKILIVEDELVNRMVLQKLLDAYGTCDIAVDGNEAIEAFALACKEKKPYDLICMDIMMPNTDGRTALKKIREMEKQGGIKGQDEVKVIMTTAIGEVKTMVGSYMEGATSYIVKPIEKEKLIQELQKLGLIA